MTQKELYATALDYLESVCPSADTELHFKSNFQMLVAVVLSAQCTDARINKITPALFATFPDAPQMAKATKDEILNFIHSVSYPNSKANYLVNLSQMLVEKFSGNVPETVEELTELPGVGRKTANVIQALAFGKAAIAVDTHVFRVSRRIGLVSPKATTPYKVEMELMKHIPTANQSKAHFWLLYHGRYTCTARRPHCNKCQLTACCKFFKANIGTMNRLTNHLAN